jgi:hypothetical protein
LLMFSYFKENVDGGSFFLCLEKICLWISSGGRHSRWYQFCISVARIFLNWGVRTLLIQTPTTAHLRSSSDIFEVVLMALAIGDLEITKISINYGDLEITVSYSFTGWKFEYNKWPLYSRSKCFTQL